MSTKKKATVTPIKAAAEQAAELVVAGQPTLVESPLDQITDTEGLIQVNDLDSFVTMITAWHTANADMLRKMAQIPGDGSITVEFEGQPYELQGDMHKGFLMGIQTSLGMFGQLPFIETTEIPEASNDEPAQTD